LFILIYFLLDTLFITFILAINNAYGAN